MLFELGDLAEGMTLINYHTTSSAAAAGQPHVLHPVLDWYRNWLYFTVWQHRRGFFRRTGGPTIPLATFTPFSDNPHHESASRLPRHIYNI